MLPIFSGATGLPATPQPPEGGWPVRPTSSLVNKLLTRLRPASAWQAELWLQAPSLAICAAKSKHSGGMIGKIRSTRLEGISDIKIKPPTLQQSSHKVSGDMSRIIERSRHFRE